MIITPLILTAGMMLAVPDPQHRYDWVCGWLDTAPTLFGVIGLLPELQERGLDPASSARPIHDVVDHDCPQHADLVDTALPLVVN